MGSESLVRVKCDRCGDVIEEAGADVVQGESDSILLLNVGGLYVPETIEFSDLCKRCVPRVQALVGQLKLPHGRGGRRGRRKKEAENPENSELGEDVEFGDDEVVEGIEGVKVVEPE